MLRAVAYCRTSNKQHSGSAKEDQPQECRRHAFANDIEIVDWYTDQGVSGGMAPEDRPAFFQMMERLREDPVDFLIVSARSRLGRTTLEIGITEAKLARMGVRVTSPGTPEGDGPFQSFAKTIQDAANELMRANAQDEARRSVARRREKGLKLGPNTPLGYAADEDGRLVPHEAEQAALARARELRAEGKGWHATAKILDAWGHPARGARWQPATLRLALDPAARERSRKRAVVRRTRRAHAVE